MNAIFVLPVKHRNASFSDFKLHRANRISNINQHKAPGLSERLSRKKAPNDFASAFCKTLEIGHLRVRANFIALDLRKVLHFIHLDNASSGLSLLEFDHREERLHE